ncbi:MAG: iron-containing alcohol dehydrogenase [Verrucomicrobiota bacterium]
MAIFSFPTTIHFGPGVRSAVARFLSAQNLSRPLLVTDRGIAPLPMFAEFTKNLNATGSLEIAVFSEVFGNPTKSQVTAGVEAFRRHKADSIVGLGGGAALDVAKAIALMAHHPGDLFDYEDGKADALPFDRQIPFWVALPTTSGTGSEVGRSAVISDDATHIKKIIFSPKLLAQAVFADPELTLDLPAKITAATGMDALTHCIEAFLAKNFHPLCDGIALEGLRLAGKSLEKTVKSPADIEARSDMMMASMMGAIAFQKGLGLNHSCAHALSAVVNLHHGLANAVMLPYALPFNFAIAENRFARMATTLDLKERTGPAFIHWLCELNRTIGIPEKLSQLGVKREQFPALVKIASKDSCHSNNPRLVTAQDFQTIFEDAL